MAAKTVQFEIIPTKTFRKWDKAYRKGGITFRDPIYTTTYNYRLRGVNGRILFGVNQTFRSERDARRAIDGLVGALDARRSYEVEVMRAVIDKRSVPLL